MSQGGRDVQEVTLPKPVVWIVSIPIVVVYTIWAAWIESILWRWYVVPVTAWHAISIAQAVGLSAFVSCSTGSFTYSRIEDKKLLKYAIVVPIFALFVGWIGLHF